MDLLNDIKDIIYEEIPLNLACPHCEAEIEVDCIMDKKSDSAQWDKMTLIIVRRVIEAMGDSIADMLQDMSDRDIKYL